MGYIITVAAVIVVICIVGGFFREGKKAVKEELEANNEPQTDIIVMEPSKQNVDDIAEPAAAFDETQQEQLGPVREAVLVAALKYDTDRLKQVVLNAELAAAQLDGEDLDVFASQVNQLKATHQQALDALAAARTEMHSGIAPTQANLDYQLSLWRIATDKFGEVANLIEPIEQRV
jgi:hypothetical protein